MGEPHYEPLPDDLLGYYDFATDSIWINSRQSQVGQRCTLAHELIHARDKDKPISDPWLNQKRERQVEREAACQLITVEQIAEAIRWDHNPLALCDQLNVDLAILKARIDALTENDRNYLHQIFYSRHEGTA